jgi:hypothetical protein
VTEPVTAVLLAMLWRDALIRIHERARRGLALKEWGLKARTTPLDPESSLAADDAGFLTDYASDSVSGSVLFPIMNATDNLAAAAELIEWRPQSRNTHVAALLTLCRTAAESSARTIWLLSETDRAIRRSRCVRFEASELDNQRGFHKSERDWFDAHPELTQGKDYTDFVEHVRRFHQRVRLLQKGLQVTPKTSVPSSSEVVAVAAEWVTKHRPAHDPEPYADHFVEVATRFYRVGSGFVHGCKWAFDYVQTGELETFRRAAEGLGVAVGLAECAVALYEAQAQRHGAPTERQQFYPDTLEPTVKEWSSLYV